MIVIYLFIISITICKGFNTINLKTINKSIRNVNRSFMMSSKTMFDKIWESHLVDESDSNALIYIDRHLVHEVTSPQAFEGLRIAGRSVRRPDCTLVTVDHNIPTTDRSNYKDSSSFILESDSRIQVVTLEENIKELGLTYFGLDDKRQGIVHIIGPEQGFTLPGSTIVCGDSHTATHGAFGALAFGIGTSEVEHVLATQTLIQSKAKNMRISVDGDLPTGVTSKDIILHIIGAIGTAGGTGHVIEFAGSAIKSLSMEARMSICNMAIEAGARAGMIAPDEITFEYLKGRPMAPKGELWNQAVKYWNTLSSDPDAKYDKDIIIPASSIAPTVTWGTSPQDALPITGVVPDPKDYSSNPDRAATIQRSLDYMGLIPGTPLNTIKIDKVFIGSCTNARIEDIRAAASIAKGRKVASHVYAMVVPGSGLVKAQAEFEGLDVILKEAGFDWREPGCSMCLAMNPDKLEPGERCASTSNRNFEGRQGTGGRTHLVSPAMAAAAAVSGHLTDVREVDAAIINLPSETSAFTDLLEAINRPAENSITPTKTSIASTSEDIVISDPTKQFTEITGIAAKLAIQNIDTDMIIPKQFLKTIKRSGLGGALFYNLRYENNIEKPDFILNQGKFRQSSILVAGENFGCGSSREHAPWALYDFGIRAIISTSYADIFYNNCFKNGILPINLSKNEVELLMKDADEGLKLNINLHTNSITRESGDVISFSIDSFRRDCLLNGLDDIGLTMKKLTKIQEFERKRSIHEPWYDNASQIFITSSSKVNN